MSRRIFFLWGECLFLTSDVGHIGHEVATANEAEDGDAVVLVQDAQRAQPFPTAGRLPVAFRHAFRVQIYTFPARYFSFKHIIFV